MEFNKYGVLIYESLITGGSGFIGSAITKKLLERDIK